MTTYSPIITTPFKMPSRKPRVTPELPSIWLDEEENILSIEPNIRSRSPRETNGALFKDHMETARRKLRMAISFEDVLQNGFFVNGEYLPTVQFSLTPSVARQ
ncbi:hypothetical protein K7432_010419 [Basidiobolus ranarum]|uniref:Uncharacterized protein n=1 Tax=Basidiobolus ranarum TaxID=34480 RepID=A0ABR2VVH2_9FUNG